MKYNAFLTVAAFASFATAPALAATIVASDTGLAAPDTTVTFNEVMLNDGELVTDQFAGSGVTFAPGVSYDNQVSARPNFSGAAALSFFGNDFSILFSEVVSDFAVNMTANFGSITATALLNGVLVESFSHTFPLNSQTPVSTNQNNFFGFTDLRFDEVSFVQNGSTTTALDNVAFNVAAVPVPASLPLLLAGMGVFGILRRRQRRNAD